jgi:hypothetical protein
MNKSRQTPVRNQPIRKAMGFYSDPKYLDPKYLASFMTPLNSPGPP